MSAPRSGPGREVIAARQLIQEWRDKIVVPKLKVFDTPREEYVQFSEWLYSKVGVLENGGTSNFFEMEVFRRMLPRYDIFQMVIAYLPKQPQEVSK